MPNNSAIKLAGVAQVQERQASSLEVAGGRPAPRSIHPLPPDYWTARPRPSRDWLAVALFGGSGLLAAVLIGLTVYSAWIVASGMFR